MGKEKKEKIEVKTDCFAYKKEKYGGQSCKALRELYCRYEKCKFYKREEPK